MNLDAFLTFLGRLHPSVVHFPIALLVVAALLGILGARRPTSDAVLVLVRLGAIAAIVAAGLGWLFAEHDPPARGLRDALLWHRWAGVGTAVLAVAATISVGRARRAGKPAPVLALLVVAIGVSWTGHLGGTMVYGEDFLTEPFREKATDASPTVEPGPVEESAEEVHAVPAEVSFQADVLPIFAKHCFDCHGPEGPAKAGLRLADEDALFEDVPELWVVLPGQPDESLLLQLVRLPPDDEDHMPKEGDPLDEDELATLRAWIESMPPRQAGG
ncbi:MAG TPA: hypothetical protein ENJ09_01990 [Planctomycetes bacterium]|nr:hypothetical protein [Planctomycetota bacterium]